MKYLFSILFSYWVIQLSAQISLTNETYYDFPIQKAVFAQGASKQPAWVTMTKEDAVPQAVTAAAVAADMGGISFDENNTESITKAFEPATISSNHYIIRKADGTQIELGEGEQLVYGNENEFVTFDNDEGKIRKFLIEDKHLQALDSVEYSSVPPISSAFRVLKTPNKTLYYVAESIGKDAKVYTIFNQALEPIFYLKLERTTYINDIATFSVISNEEIRCFYTELGTYKILLIPTTKGKIQEETYRCACKNSPSSSIGITEMAEGEYVVYHGCVDTRTTMLYAYNKDNTLKWTQKAENYFTDFVYMSSTKTLVGMVYSVPYSGFISLSAVDGNLNKEIAASELFTEASGSGDWLVYMPKTLSTISNGAKTICLLNCYSPANPNFSQSKLLIFDGKTEQGLVLPPRESPHYSISVLDENHIYVQNGRWVGIFEIK